MNLLREHEHGRVVPTTCPSCDWWCGQGRDAFPCPLPLVNYGRLESWLCPSSAVTLRAACPVPHLQWHNRVDPVGRGLGVLTLRHLNRSTHPTLYLPDHGVGKGKMPFPSCPLAPSAGRRARLDPQAREQENWPCPLLAAAFRKVGPEPCPGNTVALALVLWVG